MSNFPSSPVGLLYPGSPCPGRAGTCPRSTCIHPFGSGTTATSQLQTNLAVLHETESHLQERIRIHVLAPTQRCREQSECVVSYISTVVLQGSSSLKVPPLLPVNSNAFPCEMPSNIVPWRISGGPGAHDKSTSSTPPTAVRVNTTPFKSPNGIKPTPRSPFVSDPRSSNW